MSCSYCWHGMTTLSQSRDANFIRVVKLILASFELHFCENVVLPKLLPCTQKWKKLLGKLSLSGKIQEPCLLPRKKNTQGNGVSVIMFRRFRRIKKISLEIKQPLLRWRSDCSGTRTKTNLSPLPLLPSSPLPLPPSPFPPTLPPTPPPHNKSLVSSRESLTLAPPSHPAIKQLWRRSYALFIFYFLIYTGSPKSDRSTRNWVQ